MTMAVLKLKSSDGTYLNYTLDKPITTLGRSKTNDITVDDTSVSRLHVRIENRNGQYFVIDNNSSNGTYLNRRKVSTAPLQDGDTLIAGQEKFHFSHKVIGGMKTQALPLMDAGDSLGRQNQTMAVPRDDIPDMTSPAPPTDPNLHPPVTPPQLQATPPNPMQAPAGEPQFRPSTPPPPVAHPTPPIMPPPAPASPPAPSMAPPAAPPSPPGHGTAPNMPYQNLLDPELFDVASPFSRLIAQIIDSIAIFLFVIPSVIVGFLGMQTISLILSLLPLVAVFVNLFGGWLKYGKTIGKHFMGIRIVDLDNPTKQGLSPGVMVKRIIGYFICGITFNLLYLTILFDDEGRGFHDKFSNTKVVKY